MRRSAPTSVAMGTMLEVGESVVKNQAPRNPSVGLRASAQIVSATRISTTTPYGAASVSVSARGTP